MQRSPPPGSRSANNNITPIFIIAGFNLWTLAMYMVAPFVLSGRHVLLSYGYVLLNITALVVGYIRAIKPSDHAKVGGGFQSGNLSLYRFATLFYAMTFLVKYGYLLRYSPLDITGMVQHLLIGIYDPQLGYKLAVDDNRPFTIAWSIFFIISIIDGLYFILGFLLWPRLSVAMRIVLCTFISVEIFYWAGRGTNFGIISLLMSIMLSSLLQTHGRIRIGVALRYLALFALALGSFSAVMYARSGSAADNPQAFALQWSYVDEGNAILSMTPDFLHTTLLSIFDYVVQGYYYMSFAFDLDFVPAWLGGWNPAVSSMYSAMGFDVTENTYVARLIAFGIDPRINWHSAYTWIANDVSFIGVPLVIYLLGAFIARSWIKATTTDDLASKVVFVLLAGSAMLLFANENYIGYYFYSFMFVFPFWLWRNLTRRRVTPLMPTHFTTPPR